MDALTLIDKLPKLPLRHLYVLYGDQDFLKRQIRQAIQTKALGDADPEFAVSQYTGETADFKEIRVELDTLPFLCERRVVIIENADSFVTKNRPALETHAAAVGKTSVLVLEVKTFAGTTRLAQLVPDDGSVECKGPTVPKAAGWSIAWAKNRYQKILEPDAADMLVESAGVHLGLLDQELGKLSAYVGDRLRIELADAEALVGRSRAANVFKIMDAIGDGKPAIALNILHQLFQDEESPLGILLALAHNLRRLAAVGYHVSRKVSPDVAMDRANVPKWPVARESIRKQLRHFGPQRIARLPGWLLETDLGLKGGSTLPERLQVERFLLRLARRQTP
jgi:DNA polymerase III subunit delta